MSIRIDIGAEWGRAVAALRLADRKIPKDQRALVDATAREAVRAAQRRLNAMPVKGSAGSNATRARIAGGTAWQRRRNRIAVKAPPGMEALPWGFQSASGFRHPVFGNDNVWVNQVHNWDWFYGPISETFDGTDEELHRQLEKVALLIDKMTNGR